MSDKPKGKRVLILGGGFGGLTAAARLRDLLDEHDTITVVDRTGAHIQGLSLLWILRGWRETGEVDVHPSGPSLDGIDLVTAEVQNIDIAGRKVTTSRGVQHYDALIIALGAQLDPGAVPGLPEALSAGRAGEFYTGTGAAAAHRRLRELRAGKVAIVVSSMPYKCPAAPWEAAFLTDDLLTELGSRPDVDLRIYTPEPQPMPVAGPVLGAAVVEMLDERRIGHHFATPISSISDDGTLTFGTGVTEQVDYALFVPPHTPPTAVKAAGFSEAGWIPVDPHTLATRQDGVWAVGDCVSITLTNGKPLPKAAVLARGQADAAAAEVARYLGRSAPESRFDGVGHCLVETGAHAAAKGAGNFYAEGGPEVTLYPPSKEAHEEKQLEEAGWLAQWNAQAAV